jgi:hypothetical protein
VSVTDRGDAESPLTVVFENWMVKLLAGDVGGLVVEHADGYRRVLDADESDYLREVQASAIANGVPEEAYATAAGEYLLQFCLGARNKKSEVWNLVFHTVSADRMGEIIAEEYLENERDPT